jgi:hypothetical protein
MTKPMCVYCQAAPATTEDHVPPKSLFPKNLWATLVVTVPACDSCNSGNSANENRFRDVIAVMAGPTAGKNTYAKFKKTLQHEAGKRGKILADSYRNLDGALVWKTSINPLVESVEKIAKGLHYRELDKPWPLAATVDVYIDPTETVAELKNGTATEHRAIGPDFSYSYRAEDGVSIWWLDFHSKLKAIVVFEE